MSHLFICAIVLLLPFEVLRAQAYRFLDSAPEPTAPTTNTENRELFWGTVGVGAVGPGIGGLLKATYAWGHSSISAKVEGGSEFRISIFGKAPQNEVTEFSIYYGRQMISDWYILRLAAGPAYFERIHDPEPTFYRFGIGAEAEAMAKFDVIGVGIMASVMVAPDIFFGGITINLHFGKLK